MEKKISPQQRLAEDLEIFRSNLQRGFYSTSILKAEGWPHAEQAQAALGNLIRFVEMEQLKLPPVKQIGVTTGLVV